MMLYFLNRRPQGWKDKYIRGLISMAGAWGGSVKALQVFLMGDSFGLSWLFNAKKVMAQQRTAPSNVWLWPQEGFWAEDEVLVETGEKSYSVSDYRELFHDLQE